jgi:hypothetical protein
MAALAPQDGRNGRARIAAIIGLGEGMTRCKSGALSGCINDD